MIRIADGAMGTQLLDAGLQPGGCGELLNIEDAELVAAVHRTYVAAGAEIILTNTFGASRIALARHGLGELAREINEAGAVIARAAARDGVLVLGDIGPFGGFLEPNGDTARVDVFEAFAEQAHALLAGGAQGIMIETMSCLDETDLAVVAAREAGADTVVASVTFERTRKGLRTLTGATPEDVAVRLADVGADILATNCGSGLDAQDYAEIVRTYRDIHVTAPIMVKMNAGAPRLSGDRTVYDVGPDPFAERVSIVIEAGATIVGGCCGTTPQHIQALRALLVSQTS